MTVIRDGWSVYLKLLSQYSVTEPGHIGRSEDYDCYTRWLERIIKILRNRKWTHLKFATDMCDGGGTYQNGDNVAFYNK
jgi:hypothetical protein